MITTRRTREGVVVKGEGKEERKNRRKRWRKGKKISRPPQEWKGKKKPATKGDCREEKEKDFASETKTVSSLRKIPPSLTLFGPSPNSPSDWSRLFRAR
ncbi:hypothetical protein CEXT_554001 [Caerostris extrusa]|uniref:Uncharacterized protein n=1 Tax=Caerostris extrusa TaxID=172846 RepID=A0AAV4P874_CAEEX|nr:hypothetical protein CEXT_554001 [Caerostris extrusa]